MARLVFDVEVSDANGAGLSLSDFKWYRGTSLQDNVSIFDATALQDLSPEGGGSIGSGMRKIIVSFNQEETVGVWGPAYFVLKASAAGVEKDDRVVTRLASGDEETPLLDLTATGQSNTGQVYALGDASAGIFTALNEFAQAVGTARNIIWSDKWSSGHIYPDFAGNLPVSGTGSADWTNGYRLGLTELGDQTHSR